MTPLPPPPTFNREPAVLPADRPAAASDQAPVGVAAGFQFQSSDVDGESRPIETKTGELLDRRPTLIHPEAGLAPGTSETFRPPAGFVLVERELLGRLLKRVKRMEAQEREQLRERLPSFLQAPSRDYLDAVGRE